MICFFVFLEYFLPPCFELSVSVQLTAWKDLSPK